MSHPRVWKHQPIIHLRLKLIRGIVAGVIFLNIQSSIGHARSPLTVSSVQETLISDARYRAQSTKRQSRKGGTDGKPPAKKKNKSVWQEIIDLFTRRGKSAGTRSKSLCSITPNRARHVYRSWSDRPLFAWQGPMQSIELHLPGSHPNAEPLWRYQVKGSENSVFYDGEHPLKRGQEYAYHFQYSLDIDQRKHIENGQLFFKIVDQTEHQDISKELSSRNLDLPLDTSEISDALILDRALYFAEQNLYLDAVQEIFSRSLQSSHWSAHVSQLQDAFCLAHMQLAVKKLHNETTRSIDIEQ